MGAVTWSTDLHKVAKHLRKLNRDSMEQSLQNPQLMGALSASEQRAVSKVFTDKKAIDIQDDWA